MQPHCARLVAAGRRRDRDDPRNLSARTVSKRRSGRPSLAGPPPLRQPSPFMPRRHSGKPPAGRSCRGLNVKAIRSSPKYWRTARDEGCRQARLRTTSASLERYTQLEPRSLSSPGMICTQAPGRVPRPADKPAPRRWMRSPQAPQRGRCQAGPRRSLMRMVIAVSSLLDVCSRGDCGGGGAEEAAGSAKTSGHDRLLFSDRPARRGGEARLRSEHARPAGHRRVNECKSSLSVIGGPGRQD